MAISDRGRFEPTLWSVVLAARDDGDPRHQEALEALCEIYWKPVYAYLRRKGFRAQDAQDRTQGFFAHFLEAGLLARVDRGRGRFRGYLLATLEHWLANQSRKEAALIRGGGRRSLSFDFSQVEHQFAIEPIDSRTPDDEYRRTWALAALGRAFAALAAEYKAGDRSHEFCALRDHLLAGAARPSYAETAERLGTSVEDVTNVLHRLRRRLRHHLMAVLRETVESAADLDEEMQEILESL